MQLSVSAGIMEMETGRADRFCGSGGSNGADIGVFGMMSSIILTVQLLINIINSSNNNINNNNNNNNDNNNNNLNDNSMVTVMAMNMNMNQAGGRHFPLNGDISQDQVNEKCIHEDIARQISSCRRLLG